MNAALLAVSAGSSSLKFALHADDKGLTLIGKGEVSGLGSKPRLRKKRIERGANAIDALQVMLDWLATQFPDVHFSAIGHRVVPLPRTRSVSSRATVSPCSPEAVPGNAEQMPDPAQIAASTSILTKINTRCRARGKTDAVLYKTRSQT